MIRRILAMLRLSQRAICEESAGRGEYDDFHDYQDDVIGVPVHGLTLTCKHCGKGFKI